MHRFSIQSTRQLFFFYLTNPDGRRSAGETGQAGLERRDLTPGTPATGVDAGHAELVGRARLQVLLLQNAVIGNADDVNVLW